MAREGFLKDKCGPRAKKFEHHCLTVCRHTEAGVERKRPSWDPKDGESEETPVEDRGDSGHANRSSNLGTGAKDSSNGLVAGSLRSFPQSWRSVAVLSGKAND